MASVSGGRHRPPDYLRWPPAGGPGLGPGSGPQGTSTNRGGAAGLVGAARGLTLTAPGSACLCWSLFVAPDGGCVGGRGAGDDSDFQTGCQWIRLSMRKRGSEDEGGS